jgi:predicted dehydrogenase
MTLKAVIIGTSGHHYYAMQTLNDRRDAVLCGIASGTDGDLSSDAVNSITATAPSPCFASWQRMLDEVKPDIAIIGTRFDRNGVISLECLNRGINCFTEKAVAHSFELLNQLKESAAENHVKIFGMHGMRYEPHFFAAYQAVKSGLIGRPSLFFGQKSYCFGNNRPDFYKHRDTYGGTILWVGIHAIDLSYWMIGNWDNVSASHSTSSNHGYLDCESHSSMLINFADGAIGSINADFLLPGKFGSHGDDQIRVAGDLGSIWVRSGKAYAATHELQSFELPLKPEANFFKDICDEIRGAGKCLISMEDTFMVSHLAIIARQAADSKTNIKIKAL